MARSWLLAPERWEVVPKPFFSSRAGTLMEEGSCCACRRPTPPRRQFRGERFHLMLVSIFAALAALLAAVGIYGAIAFSVAQRTREFGLRMALGAMPAAIRRLTLGRTTRLTLTGAACGLAVSLVLGQLLQSALYPVPHQHSGLIYGVSIRDPLSLSAAAAIVLALAAIASLAPAGRAARVEPSAALRNE